jgi:hypothetical protein
MHQKYLSLDPSITNWFNILDPLKGRSVLKIGVNSILDGLDRCGCSSITCLSMDMTWNRNNEHIKIISDLNLLKKQSLDLCIVDDISLLNRYEHQTKTERILNKIYNLLNEHGCLLVGLPNGINHFGLKLCIGSFLKKIGFKTFHLYTCVPSFKEPLFIYPYLHDKVQTKKNLKVTSTFGESSIWGRIKISIKNVLINTNVRFNPYCGRMIVAYKDEEKHQGDYLTNIIQDRVLGHEVKKNNHYVIWATKPNTGKQIGLVYNLETRNKVIVAVCKTSHYPYYRTSSIKKEHDVLSLLAHNLKIFQNNKINLPAPLYFETNGTWILSIETPMKGIPLSKMKLYKLKLPELKEIIKTLFNIQLLIQKYLTEQMKNNLPVLNSEYFVNSLGIPYKYLDDTKRILNYQTFVQHGDYTDVNIFYDNKAESWGIIDWEWTSSGFPPLFDIFHLLYSLRCSYKLKRYSNSKENNLVSFEDAFFRNNKLSLYIKTLIQNYCRELGIDMNMIFNYFLDFLLFLYNKYRLDYTFTEYEKLHQELILYALINKDSFSL